MCAGEEILPCIVLLTRAGWSMSIRVGLAACRPTSPTACAKHKWSLDKESTWMIGDRIFDFQAPHASHIRTLAAGWG